MTKSVNAAILRFPSLVMLAHGPTGPCKGSENSPCCRYQAAPIATGTKGLVRRRLSSPVFVHIQGARTCPSLRHFSIFHSI
ncbi:hypothetical protein BCR44DRAFT_1439815, partial [Catenaria anguillulae PL171]